MMSAEAVSKSTEGLLKQVFKGDAPDWPEEDISFASFLEAINFHGMTPVFWYWINQHGFCKKWPESLLSEIKNIAMQEVASDMLAQSELKNILKSLDNIGIHPVLIKGTPLSFTLYPAPGLRPRCDTDFLISKNDFDATSKLMIQLGYHALYDADVVFLSSQKTFIKEDKSKVSHAYDVHWRISNASRLFTEALNYSDLYKDALEIAMLGDNAKTLHYTDALLLACFHRAVHFSHEGDRLIWLYDIHLLMNALDEHEFDLFYQKAKKIEIVTICADAILTAQDWFSTSITESRMKRLITLPEIEASTVYLTSGRQVGIKNHALLELKELSSMRDKFHYLFEKIFPPVNYMLWRYDTKRIYLLPFLYLYRLIYGIYIFVRR